MRRTTIGRILLAPCLAAMGLLVATPALASAQVTRFTFHEVETFADAPPECMPDVKSGVTTAVLDGSGQVTETSRGFAVHSSNTFDYRTQFPDGSFLTGTARAHSTFVVHGGHAVATDVVQEPRTIYSADGTALGTVSIHALTHTTTDLATGRTTANIDRFFFTCG
jgi:hypothetical protein